MSSVEITDLKKSFDKEEVLHGISINIPDGAFVALVGPSGCGKSTVLRLIAGLEEITSGKVLIDSKVINDVEPKNRDIAMVFQNYALYPHMTVAENLGFSLRLLKKSKSEIKKSVQEVSGMLGIDKLLKRFPKQLSGGQRQRVAMGRAIVRQPKVFLFDEPLSNLDAKLRVQMRAELKALHKRLKTTTIYVTHDQIEAMTMADIVVVMREGHVEQIGQPLELYDQPKNSFVAGFIGSPAMNFFPVSTKAGQTIVTFVDGQYISLPNYRKQDGDFILGIRPEHFHQSNTTEGLLVDIISIEQTGSETLLQCQLDEQTLMIVLHNRLMLEAGQKQRFNLDVDTAMFFEKNGGNCIIP